MSIATLKTFNIASIIAKSTITHLDAELLLAFLLNTDREYIVCHPEIKIKSSIYKKYCSLEKLRHKNWPLAYLVGKKYFYNLNFSVNNHVLVPRPETELIIDEALKIYSKTKNDYEHIIIDIGTGSGAIIISLMHELQNDFSVTFKKIKAFAIDVSSQALAVARKNAKDHQLNTNIKFICGNLLSPMKHYSRIFSKSDIIITANLPYLSKKQITQSPSISREPRLALDGGIDGLKYYHELFKQISNLPFGPRHLHLLCEIDPTQAKKITKLANNLLPQGKCTIKKDLAGHPRMVIVRF